MGFLTVMDGSCPSKKFWEGRKIKEMFCNFAGVYSLLKMLLFNLIYYEN
jgi:hypothetical protein